MKCSKTNLVELGSDKAGAHMVSKTPSAISFHDPSVATKAFQLPFDESGGRQADTKRKRSRRTKIRTHASGANHGLRSTHELGFFFAKYQPASLPTHQTVAERPWPLWMGHQRRLTKHDEFGGRQADSFSKEALERR